MAIDLKIGHRSEDIITVMYGDYVRITNKEAME